MALRSISHSDRRSTGSELPAYNQLVVQHQDEAFTLACDLLADEAAASAVVAEAFRDSYRDRRGPLPQFRLEILKKVASGCQKRAKILSGPQAMSHLLTGLSNTEKTVLVLVDSLGLSYAEAGFVMGKTVSAVRQELAKARYELNSVLR